MLCPACLLLFAPFACPYMPMNTKRRRTLRSTWPLSLLFVLLALSVAVIPIFLINRLMDQMTAEERSHLLTWAKATEALADPNPTAPLDVMLHIVQSNKTIPVILTDQRDSVVSFNNILVPPGQDTTRCLQERLAYFKKGYPPIEIRLAPDIYQYIYYSESNTLRKLQLSPYAQVAAFLLYFLLLVLVLRINRRSEQNRIWVGLTKETAHQLGTPISSLMAWSELMEANPETPPDAEMIADMKTDIERLRTVADRFQKVGSVPKLTPEPLYPILQKVQEYMVHRVSKQVHIRLTLQDEASPVALLSPSLLEWVVENLVKNAVDAMSGRGVVEINCRAKGAKCIIDVSDEGKGIPRSKFRTVFKPGYTTKTRGWGLGLSLSKRIVRKMLHGHIFVKSSEPGVRTTFRITLPRVK